jgi:phenylpyruvate tautomerase PptA (4-oxalocrotonate tautomerase family)
MNLSLAYPPARYDPEQARQLVAQLTRAFARVLSTETASPYLLLTSPDQSVWKVTIDDTGALAAVKLPKGQPP